MTIQLTLPLAQCPCPSGNLLPLIVVGFAIWGLWRASEWMAARISKRRELKNGSGGAKVSSVMVFIPLMGLLVLLVLGGMAALRSTQRVALASTDHPRLIFLGSGRCKPCKAMEPVREALRSKYAGVLIIEYHDVWKDPEPGHRFGIRTIPTTIFVGPDGGELLRRQKYLSENEIVNKWNELGFALKKGKTNDENE